MTDQTKPALLSKLRAPVADERQPDGKRPDLDWIEGVQVTDTVGRGWCVRIDGTDIFEDVNRYGCKGRRSFQIAAGLPSKQEAERAAVEWLDRQRAALASAPVAGEAQQPAEYQRRCRPTWENARVGWTEWERCTAEQAAECEKATLVHDWQYEVRRLYTAPKGSSVAMPIEQRCQNWESLKEQLNSADWTVSESVSYRGFFMLGVEAAIEFYAAPQASEADPLPGIDADRLRAIASSQSLTAMSNALLNVARKIGSQDSKAVCNASNAFDDWLATHCDSDDLEAFEVKLARDAWCAALPAQPGAQKGGSDGR